MRIVYNSKLVVLAKKLHILPEFIHTTTLVEWIFTERAELSQEFIYHEQRHIWQWRWHLYVFFLPMYGLLALVTKLRGKDAYWDHPYERDARVYAERRVASG